MDTVAMQFCSAVSAQSEADAGDLATNTLGLNCNQEELDAQILLCKEQK